METEDLRSGASELPLPSESHPTDLVISSLELTVASEVFLIGCFLERQTISLLGLISMLSLISSALGIPVFREMSKA